MESNPLVMQILMAPLFSSLTESEVDSLVSSSSLHTFCAGNGLEELAQGTLCFVVNGKADVFSVDGKRKTILKTIKKGELFGVASLFSGSEPVSRIVAKVKSEILLIPKQEITLLFSRNPQFAADYISFLEKKIAFLNKRISSFTAGSCERKLALFLCASSQEEEFLFSMPFSSLAKQLDMGRASFYRALSSLEKSGFVEGSEKSIRVLSRSSMKKKYTL